MGIIAHIPLPIEPFTQLTESQNRAFSIAGVKISTMSRMGDTFFLQLTRHIIVTRSWRCRWNSFRSCSRCGRGDGRRDGRVCWTSAIKSWTLTQHAGVQCNVENQTLRTLHLLVGAIATNVVTGAIFAVRNQVVHQMTRAYAYFICIVGIRLSGSEIITEDVESCQKYQSCKVCP